MNSKLSCVFHEFRCVANAPYKAGCILKFSNFKNTVYLRKKRKYVGNRALSAISIVNCSIFMKIIILEIKENLKWPRR